MVNILGLSVQNLISETEKVIENLVKDNSDKTTAISEGTQIDNMCNPRTWSVKMHRDVMENWHRTQFFGYNIHPLYSVYIVQYMTVLGIIYIY